MSPVLKPPVIDPLCPTCQVSLFDHLPGQCLDEWVDRAVFGRVFPCHHEMEAHAAIMRAREPSRVSFDAFGGFFQFGPAHDVYYRYYVDQYSTNLANAFQVLEWVWKQCSTATLHAACVRLPDLGYPGGVEKEIVFPGDSHPLRICRAAIWLAAWLRYQQHTEEES